MRRQPLEGAGRPPPSTHVHIQTDGRIERGWSCVHMRRVGGGWDGAGVDMAKAGESRHTTLVSVQAMGQVMLAGRLRDRGAGACVLVASWMT